MNEPSVPEENKPDPRPISYLYKDTNLGPNPFPIYEARLTAWWMDGGAKLTEFLGHIKRRCTVVQACYLSAISYDQYRDFKAHHPWLVPVMQAYRSLVPLKLKDIILQAAIGDEKNGIKPNAKMALGAIHLFPDEETDPDFAPKPANLPIPPGGSSNTLIAQDIVDGQGKVVLSRRAAEIIKNNGNDPSRAG